MNTENEIYSLASCPGTKYSGDSITLKATPKDGIGPYYVAFKKDGIIIDPSRLGSQPNPITNATEDVEITRTYTLDDTDVRNALTGNINFSVFIRGSCPTDGGLQFDGINDYVNTGNNASLNIENEITVSAWIKPIVTTSGHIVRKYDTAGAENGYIFGINSGKLHLRTYGSFQTNGNVILNDNTYYMATFTVLGTSVKLYLNGVLDKSTTLTFTNATGYNLFVGGVDLGYLSYASYFNGSIDEVRIYNRALSPTEVLGLYNGSTPRDGLVLEHIYSLGNANDLSGYGNNGTPINGPIFIPNACMDTCTIPIGCVAPVCNFVVT